MDVYALDSSVIINMNRHTPISYYPSLWTRFEGLVNDNRVCSIDFVYNEIIKGDDGCKDWVKRHSDIFLPINESIVQETKNIINKYTGLIRIDDEKDQADPYLIGFAKVNNFIVLTDEKLRENGKTKIPNVCKELGISCLDLFGLFEKEGWKF